MTKQVVFTEDEWTELCTLVHDCKVKTDKFIDPSYIREEIDRYLERINYILNGWNRK